MTNRRNSNTPLSFRVRTGTRLQVAYILLCLLVAGGISACGSSPTESHRETLVRKSYTAIQNPNNPYNVIGVLHNEGLDYFADNVGSSDTSQTDIEELIAAYLVEVGVGKVVGNDTVWYDPQFVLDSIVRAYDFRDSTRTWTAHVSFSPVQQAFIDAVLDEAGTIEVPISSAKRDSSMTVFNQVENNILSSALSVDEKSVPLALVAVAKHSLEYWSDYPEYYSSWFEGEGSEKVADREKIKEVIRSDAKGLIFGAFTGFLGGAIAGGIGGLLVGNAPGGAVGAAGGAVVGSFVGSVTGAIGGSLTTAASGKKK